MLSRLHIRNYVLIDSLDISFPGGLIIITGRTGAGKSILLGALNLVLGGKAGPEMIGSHGDGCVVEADFELRSDSPFKAFFEENDLEWNDGQITIRRTVSAAGRSRSFIGDLPVPVGVLSEIAADLVDIHSQQQTRILTDAAYQLEVLDRYAGCSADTEACRALWKRLGALRKDYAALQERMSRQQEELEFNAARLERLNAARLVEGELEELEAEQKRLSNAEEIKENLYTAINALSPEEGGGVLSQLKDASRAINRAGKYIPEAESLEERMDASRTELDDILSALEDIAGGIEVSGDRLQQVEERLSALYTLMKLHRVTTLEELIAVRDRLQAEFGGAESLEEQSEQLKAEIRRTEAEYNTVGERLAKLRRDRCVAFSEAIAGELRFMELEKATFRAEVSETAPGATGKDAVRFLFSADGTREIEVGKAASGGEMSRIMLALKAMMARYTEMPTMIFDEIDTGVSGSAADKMGSVICAMGRDMQVLAITHLPQVAAKGDAHYLVTKNEDPATGESVTGISEISGEDRLLELARMLSGSSLTEAAIRNAAALIQASQA